MADVTSTSSLSALITAGETIFTAITGKSSANVEKVTSGLSTVADGSLPYLESKVSFDLASVIAGATAILSGIALMLTGLKKKTTTTTTAATGTTGTATTTTTATSTANTATTATTGGVG